MPQMNVAGKCMDKFTAAQIEHACDSGVASAILLSFMACSGHRGHVTGSAGLGIRL